MTNALIQRSLVCFCVLLGALLALHYSPSRPILAWAWLMLPLWITLVLIGLQCVASCIVNRTDPAASPGLAGWLQVWVRETLAAWRVFSWWQPFHHHAIADHWLSERGTRRGIVLVHGFFCNRALWTLWMRHLKARGHPFVVVDLEPAFGSISQYAKTIDAAVKRMTQATGMAPVLVGHSMGGLAIRFWLRSLGNIEKIHQIITIGTPHHGTALARWSFSTNGHEMRTHSAWLAALESAEQDTSHEKFICFYSSGDNIVCPATSATLPGADNRLIAQRGHVDLLFAPQVQAACWQALSLTD